jgi:hypothetical protein
MPAIKSQADARMLGVFTDQHGRKWEAVIEKNTGHPCSHVRPRFTAPYLPDQQYLTFDAHERSTLVIDYDRAIADRRDARKTYDEMLYQFALGTYGDQAAKYLPPEGKPTEAMRRYVGATPPAPEIPEAAKAGNKWVLGLTDVKPSWAEQHFPTKPAVIARDLAPDVNPELAALAALYPDDDTPPPAAAARPRQKAA